MSTPAAALLLVPCVLLVPATAFAQSLIAGTVRDISAAVLPGVTVEAASPVLIDKVCTVSTNELHQTTIDEAVAELRAALRLDPGYPRAHDNLGSILLLLGRTAEAIEDVREAVRLDPTYVGAHTNLPAAPAALGEFQRAVDIIESALKLNLADAVAAVLRGRLEAYRRSSSRELLR